MPRRMVWVAVNYPLAITLLINTLLMPAEPQHQLKAEIHRQFDAVDARLGRLSGCEDTLARVTLEPNWQEGEHAQFTVRAQVILAQGREIMRAANSLHNALSVGKRRWSRQPRSRGRTRLPGLSHGIREARAWRK